MVSEQQAIDRLGDDGDLAARVNVRCPIDGAHPLKKLVEGVCRELRKFDENALSAANEHVYPCYVRPIGIRYDDPAVDGAGIGIAQKGKLSLDYRLDAVSGGNE